MPRGFRHCLKNPFNKIIGHIAMEKIAHRIDEYYSRLFPFKRQGNQVFMQSDLKPIGISRLPHTLKAQGNALGVAIAATKADFAAAGRGVP
jgi:hypothetical protein